MGCCRFLLLASIWLVWAVPAAAQSSAPEAEVKAAVVFNLLAFVQWPPEAFAAGGQLTLCGFEAGAVDAALSRYEGMPVHGLPLARRRIAGGAEEFQQCQAVFVAAGNPSALRRSAAAAGRGLPLLVIGEGAGALDGGGMIGLGVIGGRVVLDVDQSALRRSHLTASSKLLRLARTLVE